MSQPVHTERPGLDRFLLGIALGAIALIVLGIIAVMVVGGPAPAATVDPDSPAGVVTAYVEALQVGDLDQAKTYLTQPARGLVERDSYPGGFTRPAQLPETEQRILIEPVRLGADSAEVRVTVSTFTAQTEPFSTSTYHREVTVRLIPEDGVWRITQPIEPYFFS